MFESLRLIASERAEPTAAAAEVAVAAGGEEVVTSDVPRGTVAEPATSWPPSQ
jgi:hypothetical protein